MGRASWFGDDETDSSEERHKTKQYFSEAWTEYYAEMAKDLNEEGEFLPEINSLSIIDLVAQLNGIGECTGSIEGEHIMPIVASLSRKIDEISSSLTEMEELMKSSISAPVDESKSSLPSSRVVIVMFLIFFLTLWYDKGGIY